MLHAYASPSQADKPSDGSAAIARLRLQRIFARSRAAVPNAALLLEQLLSEPAPAIEQQLPAHERELPRPRP